MLQIGFANKYYTLWEVGQYEKTDKFGKYVVTYANYLQNLSMDKDRAFEKEPSATFNENLRGHSHSFVISSERVKYADECFQYGKYAGEKISECNDWDYLFWYYGNAMNNKAVCDRLTQSPYHYYYAERDMYVTIADYNEIKREQAQRDEWMKVVENNEPFEFLVASNLQLHDGDDYATTDNVLDENGDDIYSILLCFDNYKEMQYQGYPYYLPALNGKAKRIKNKTIIITDYTVENEERWFKIHVNNFEIKK